MSVPAISSGCHTLTLPPAEKDDRLNLNVRTGSCSTLYNSLVFVFGGLTLGMDLPKISVHDIISHFTHKVANTANSKNFLRYLSNELFYLDLIGKSWSRAIIPPDAPKPSPRLFSEMVAFNNCVYIYGGLVINPKYKLSDADNPAVVPADLLLPTNDVWEFNLETNHWTPLYVQGPHNKFIPRPSFCHKLTKLESLSFAGKPDHYGILIAGGKNLQSTLLFDNLVFDLVDRQFVPGDYVLHLAKNPYIHFINSSDISGNISNDISGNIAGDSALSVDYCNSSIVGFSNQFNHYNHLQANESSAHLGEAPGHTSKPAESLLVYSPVTNTTKSTNPLVLFKLTKSIKPGKCLPVHRKLQETDSMSTQIIPFALKYPIAGLFGQNLILTGFLPNDYDISIFVFNRPTGKWSRLNIFCNHDYGSHRFWGGFAWHSHHKVVLLGNYVTSRTTSSVRYFTCLITVNLPVTNILASSELAGGGHYHDDDGNRIYFDDDNSSSSTSSDISDDISDEGLPPENRPLTPPPDSRRPSYVSKGSRGSVSTAKSPRAISFSEYVHYAAPTANFTTINSIFPPAAITLGRNFFDRFGDLTADFEIISVNGDRIPVSLMVLIERWGDYFIELLARGYVSAVEKFDESQQTAKESAMFNDNPSFGHIGRRDDGSSFSSVNSHDKKTKTWSFASSSSLQHESQANVHPQLPKPKDDKPEKTDKPDKTDKTDKPYHLSMSVAPKKIPKDAPHFRIPFQDTPQDKPKPKAKDSDDSLGVIEGETSESPRKGSVSSFSSTTSLLQSRLQDIPPQLPLPTEPVPPVPTNPPTFRNSSRRNSNDVASPRGSLMHTLVALRNIPTRSPRGSPYSSPRASMSHQGGIKSTLTSSEFTLKPLTMVMPEPPKSDDMGPGDDPDGTESPSSKMPISPLDNILLNFENLENGTFQMEPSLIPRKLYIPFTTASIKAFCEYLYKGQIGNKWLLAPTALDNLVLAKYYKIPLLYDLISEVLYGIIGRREAWVIKKANELKSQYLSLLTETGIAPDFDMEFPLDEYQGFIDTVDDGYLDLALLRKSLRFYQDKKRKPSSRRWSRRSSSKSSIDKGDIPSDTDDDNNNNNDNNNLRSESDKIESSASDTDDNDNNPTYEIGYFNTSPGYANIGPRSKSIFDRETEKKRPSLDTSTQGQGQGLDNATKSQSQSQSQSRDKLGRSEFTLEQLISPVSPIPEIDTIDLISEAVNLVADLKLILRVNNVQQMSKLLEEFENDIADKISEIRNSYEQAQALQPKQRVSSSLSLNEPIRKQMGPRSFSSETVVRANPSSIAGTGSHTNLSLYHGPPHHTASTTALSELAGNTLERTRTNSSLRTGLSGLTPLKPVKTETKVTNKDAEKRLAKVMKMEKRSHASRDPIFQGESSGVREEQVGAKGGSEVKEKKKNKFLFGHKKTRQEPELVRNDSGTDSIISESTQSTGPKKKHTFLGLRNRTRSE